MRNERGMISLRTKAGIEKARLDGVKFGRPVGKINRNSLYKAETDLAICRDANQNNIATIKTLQDANAEYAAESEKQAKDVAEAQESLERAQKRIQAQEKAFNKELDRAYKKNPSWADGAVPADVKRVFDRAD